jgi:CBS domain containing-hemolysin-like protein
MTAQALEDAGVAEAASYAVALAVGVMTFLIVVFGEVVPKTFAKQHPRRMVPVFPVTYLAFLLFRPFAAVLQRATGWMLSGAGGSRDGTPEVTEAEIESMIRLGEAQGTLQSDKQELLSSIIDFSETMTKEIMVPRTDVEGLPVGATLADVLAAVSSSRFSRYPIYDEDLDSIVGIVTVKDLFEAMANPDRPFSLPALAVRHKTLIVPETKKIVDLLKEFQRERVQMAIAVDEFGGTAGLVTMEDVIEEIVGEIYDEHERSEAEFRAVAPGRYLVQGRAAIEDLAEVFPVDLPEQDIYETVGGLVMTQAGRVPQSGDVIEFAGLRFEVRERTKTRVLSVLVSRIGDTGGPAADEAGR